MVANFSDEDEFADEFGDEEATDESLEEEEMEEEVKKKPVNIKRVTDPAERKPLQQLRKSPIAEKIDEQVTNKPQSQNRFVLYSVPERILVMDTFSQKPIAEAADPQTLTAQLQVDIINRLEVIQRNLGV